MDLARFPSRRLRRLRRGAALRDAVADVRLSPAELIYPVFVTGSRRARPVASMPGVSQWPVNEAVKLMRDLSRRGLRQFLLFGVTPAGKKEACGRYAASADAPVNRALARVRSAGWSDGGRAVVMYADLCLCEYTDHGHCGVPAAGDDRGVVDNDATLAVLGEVAQAQARAGADVVAPSGMMDGQVGAVRAALDQGGCKHTAIMAYSVKYASSFYGPFREAGEGGMKSGDRAGYQMDVRRRREWRLELAADLAEGADIVMVKPGAACLDILWQVRQACDVPVAAYHVSGEYALLHAGAQRGCVDLRQATLEVTFALKRAGADLIITYAAPQLALWLAGT